jgi:hypothetical protein
MGDSAQHFMQLGGNSAFYVLFIWSYVSGLMSFCDVSDKGTGSNFVQILRPCNDLTSVRGRKHELYTESSNLPRTKTVRQVRSMLIIFIHKEFVFAGQTVNFAYYCDVLK